MLHPEPGVNLQLAVIKRDWNVEDDFPVGIAQDLPEPLVQIQLAGCQVKTCSLFLPGINFLLDSYGIHHDLRRLCFRLGIGQRREGRGGAGAEPLEYKQALHSDASSERPMYTGRRAD